MSTPESSKKKQTAVTLSILLIVGGVAVLHQAGKTDVFYQNISAEGDTTWAVILGWLMIVGGAGVIFWKLTERLRD